MPNNRPRGPRRGNDNATKTPIDVTLDTTPRKYKRTPKSRARGQQDYGPYKNYGQKRSAEVHLRNANRKIAKPRYGSSQSVDEGVAQRTDKRLERLQRPVKGVNASDGYTGAEARRVKQALARRKARKLRYSI